jgi:hypothetical protein
MKRRQWASGSFKDSEKEEAAELSEPSYQERAKIITYLR